MFDNNTSTTSTRDHEPGGDRYRWVAMGVILFGAFMVVLDTTVVNLGLESVREDFGVGVGVEWVVTAYLAAVGVAQAASGWLSDRFGRRSVFIASLGIFTLSSFLCAVAVTFPMLVGMRVVQGVGGGLLMPVAMATVYELFEPEERGTALGYFGIALMAAPAIGPVLGGGLVSSLSWRWLFLINIPVGLAAIPLAIRLLRDNGHREHRPFDAAGLALSTVGLGLFLVGVSQGGIAGWSNPWVMASITIGALALIGFVVHARRSDHPLVDLSIFATPTFAIAMGVLALMAVAQYGRLIYIPLELGEIQDVSEFRIGLVMMPSALCVAAMMPIGGRLVDRIGARVPVTIGTLVMAVSFLGLWNTHVDSSLIYVSAMFALGGLGAGLAMMSPNVVAMNSLPGRLVSQGSGLSSLSRQSAAAVGVAILTSAFATVKPSTEVAVTDPDVLDPFRMVFLIGTICLVGSALVAQFLPGKRRALELQAERRAEAAAVGEVHLVEPI